MQMFSSSKLILERPIKANFAKIFQAMNIWLILIPFISAFIGWFTNWIAIKMLFHPKEPIKIMGISFHGIFPKRQQQFAEKLGKLVSSELLSFKDIEEKIINYYTLNDKSLSFLKKRTAQLIYLESILISG